MALTRSFALAALLITGCNAEDRTPPDLALVTEPPFEATSLQVLVRETACASGRDATGRVAIEQVQVTPTEIRLSLSVDPLESNEQDCPGNPWTPVTIPLDTEVAGRSIVDATNGTRLPVETAEKKLERLLGRPTHEALELLRGWQPPTDYVLLARVECYCPPMVYELIVEAGRVISRTGIANGRSERTSDATAEAAPSLTELRARILDEPSGVREIAVTDDGDLVYVSFDDDFIGGGEGGVTLTLETTPGSGTTSDGGAQPP